MLKNAGRKILGGVFATTLLNLAAPVWAGDEAGYVVDKSGKPVMSKSGCVLAPKQPKVLMEECGDIINKDSDGDGVMDDKDKCPNTPKGVAVDENGCPKDSDGDGVADYLDACPNNTAEEISMGVDAKGCPKDSDGDGVPDYRDKCPNTPAADIHKVNADGCVEDGVILRFPMKDMAYFDFDKSVLTAKGQHALNAMAEEAKKRGMTQKIEIIGYADCIGTEEYNLKLSERRAKAAADFLMALGLPANKITAQGKGESEATPCPASEKVRKNDRKVVVDMLITK